MTTYEPIKVGDKVTTDPTMSYCGTVLEIRKTKKPHIDDGDEAYVRWHKGYANWLKIHNLVIFRDNKIQK